ncbi:DUF2799 domain-containing protein [Vibrio hippocampi]|uniref:DUF2799 domain-containing protein n=1 Tax=Vibrio hippocampi TaxID=654686 RepID=A0ABM8ZLA4_9VIBR|nr:DUF2799 domain-containing protein [Vibrio hippocampi]CAH0527045.1 hypothetical protein VHP8226_02385 [Vibrio hippocampi]
MKLLPWIVVSLLLTGCAPSLDELAKEGDWQQIGYQDGVRGQLARSYSDLNQYGATVMSDYQQGYEQGVAEFCDVRFAYQIGLSGQYYTGACDGLPDAQRFRMEWQRGWQDYSSR